MNAEEKHFHSALRLSEPERGPNIFQLQIILPEFRVNNPAFGPRASQLDTEVNTCRCFWDQKKNPPELHYITY